MNIDEVSTEVPVIPGVCGFTEIVDAYDIQRSPTLELDAYRRIRFAPEVISRAEKALSAKLAVHARTTDLPTITGIHLTAQDFVESIEKLASCHEVFPIFLATDSQNVQTSVRQRFGDANVIYSASLSPGSLRESSLRDAVIDLVACTLPPLFLGTHWSGYSFVIQTLRRLRGEETVTIPRLGSPR